MEQRNSNRIKLHLEEVNKRGLVLIVGLNTYQLLNMLGKNNGSLEL